MNKKDGDNINLSPCGEIRTNVAEFQKFDTLLMERAPAGYVPHFLKCLPKKKNPIPDVAWSSHPLSFSEASAWIAEGGNIGLAGMDIDALRIVDIDDPDITDFKSCKKTLTARSGSRCGFHLYYFIEHFEGGNIAITGGEVRQKRQYTLVPGSYAEKDSYDLSLDKIGCYTVEVDTPAVAATFEDIPPAYLEAYRAREEKTAAAKERQKEKAECTTNFSEEKNEGEQASELFRLTVEEVLGFSKSPHERFPSPFHHSASGMDTSISRGLIRCWNHGVTLNAQQACCALSGFLSCEDAGTSIETHVSLFTANSMAMFRAWTYAKEKGLIARSDPIPRNALAAVAVSQNFCTAKEITDGWKLPRAAFNDAIEYIKSSGIEPGRQKIAVSENKKISECDSSANGKKGCFNISLDYKNTDFGILNIEPAYKGVNVTVTHEGTILSAKSKKKNDFYLQERTRDALFSHVKDALEVSEYNEFLSLLIPQIREVSKLQRHKALETKKDEEIIIHTSKIEHQGILYEEVYEEGTVAFVDGAGAFYESLDIDEVKYKPIYGDELKEGAVLLPSGIEDYGDEKTLITEIKAHIHKYVDVSPFFETISAYYVLLTWLYDEVNTLPYLRALGDTGCGKSRYEDVVGRICYKATIVSGAITPAPIYRLIRKWGGTIIIDEGDFKASDEQNEVVKILNCGFERGRPVVRSQKDNPDNLQFLPTFSPKILSSRKRFNDVALESRCLTEVMRETDREDVPYLLPPEFYEVETSLKNKLLKFRFKNHGSIDLLKAQKLKNVKVEDRLKQAVSSFIVLFANNEGIYDEFIKFLEAYNSELVEERSSTYEGGIIHAIFLLVKKNKPVVPPSVVTNVTNVTGGKTLNTADISDELSNIDLSGVEITATDIENVMTEELDFKAEYTTARSIGKRLKVLGFTSKRMKAKDKTTKALLILEARHLNKLYKKYIPVSVMENIGSYVSYVSYGNGGVNGVKKLLIEEHGKCELCNEPRPLTYEWTEGRIRCLICSECGKDQIELIEKQKSEEIKNGEVLEKKNEVAEEDKETVQNTWISFNVPCVYEYLVKHQVVFTMRKPAQRTGLMKAKHKKTRFGIVQVTKTAPGKDAESYYRESGFNSPEDWREQVIRMKNDPDGMDIYQVELLELVSEEAAE